MCLMNFFAAAGRRAGRNKVSAAALWAGGGAVGMFGKQLLKTALILRKH
jgi:hypothetical protein